MVTVATPTFAGPTRVLHVMPSLNEECTPVVRSYLTASPHVEHWLITTPEAEDAGQFPPQLAGVLPLPPTYWGRLRAVADAYESLRPDFVHAHSPSAGAYVRLNHRIPRKFIIYSPHVYLFERRDISLLRRAAHVLAEHCLAGRATTVAATSPREAHLAARLHRTHRIIHVPQVASDRPAAATAASRQPGSRSLAVGTGPLCAQTDPSYFAKVAASQGGLLEWMWIGDGEQQYRDILQEAGVHVTGHLDKTKTEELLASASVYVHTEAWEGSNTTPILLQAAEAGLPVVARQTPSTKALRLPDSADSPSELASHAVRLSHSSWDRAAHRKLLKDALAPYNHAAQAARLAEAYRTKADNLKETWGKEQPLAHKSDMPVPTFHGAPSAGHFRSK
ncbi:glycosyltransferase [Streptomyces lavendulocolor]|uniref:glycosyltransferase n=1 Tax=Streptomyces lavendulocolor TaxID=67316 RepID=UPI00340F62AC